MFLIKKIVVHYDCYVSPVIIAHLMMQSQNQISIPDLLAKSKLFSDFGFPYKN